MLAWNISSLCQAVPYCVWNSGSRLNDYFISLGFTSASVGKMLLLKSIWMLLSLKTEYPAHPQSFQNRILYSLLGSIQNIFKSVRPWISTRRYIKYYQNVSQIASCRVKIRKQDDQTDRPTARQTSLNRLRIWFWNRSIRSSKSWVYLKSFFLLHTSAQTEYALVTQVVWIYPWNIKGFKL